MTSGWRETVPCLKCGCSVSTEPPFNTWVRGHPDLDSRRQHIVITDSDMWVHRYARKRKGITYRDVQCMMLVEIKTHGADLTDTQRDTLHFVNQLLRTEKWKEQRINGRFAPGHAQNTARVRCWSHMNRRHVEVRCYGAHKLRLSGADPLDSELITWDDKDITASQLVEVLRFDRHPDSLNPNEWRRHKQINRDPVLWQDSD